MKKKFEMLAWAVCIVLVMAIVYMCILGLVALMVTGLGPYVALAIAFGGAVGFTYAMLTLSEGE